MNLIYAELQVGPAGQEKGRLPMLQLRVTEHPLEYSLINYGHGIGYIYMVVKHNCLTNISYLRKT